MTQELLLVFSVRVSRKEAWIRVAINFYPVDIHSRMPVRIPSISIDKTPTCTHLIRKRNVLVLVWEGHFRNSWTEGFHSHLFCLAVSPHVTFKPALHM